LEHTIGRGAIKNHQSFGDIHLTPFITQRAKLLALASLACFSMLFSTLTLAQAPVKILVGFPPGGGVDAVARMLAERLEKITGRAHIVENRSGAGGSLPARALLTVPADGNTLLLAPDTTVIVYPYTVTTAGFNPSTDLMTIARVTSYDFALTVRGNNDIRNLDQLREAIKNNSKAASIANPAAGNLLHFYAIALTKALSLENITHVPYRGVAPAITDTIGGEVTALVTPVGPVLQQAVSGRLQILATSGSDRGAKTPNIPTLKELGYPQLVSSGWFGLFAPAKTPADVIQKINDSVKQALLDPAMHSKLAALDMEAAWNSTQDFRSLVDSEGKKWAAVVKASGFKADQ
jgi:hypothetical protein